MARGVNSDVKSNRRNLAGPAEEDTRIPQHKNQGHLGFLRHGGDSESKAEGLAWISVALGASSFLDLEKAIRVSHWECKHVRGDQCGGNSSHFFDGIWERQLPVLDVGSSSIS